jgi:cation diffusion facilitator CzcD-associated flavoprotein CzcO
MNAFNHQRPAPPSALKPDIQIAVIGAGFSGLGAAIKLQEAGFDDHVVFERGPNIGGTWRDNTYPGCACDVESHLYSFSFAQKPDWTRRFAQQPEILAYLEDVARRFKLDDRIRLNTFVTRAVWNEAANYWQIATCSAKRMQVYMQEKGHTNWSEIDYNDADLPSDGGLTTQFLIAGTGPLSRVSYPNIKGLHDFGGQMFHSGHWDHNIELKGKRVAVIGTGSSAAQFVPAIAPDVAHMDVYQRTPNWIWPRNDHAISPRMRSLFEKVPALRDLERAKLYLSNESRALGLAVDPRLMKLGEILAMHHMRSQIKDPELRRRLTPNYRLGCKRIVVSDDWYPTFLRDNVSLITDGVREITKTGVVTEDGVEHPADVIILGTGYAVQNVLPEGMIIGREGRDLHTWWKDGVRAYLGTTSNGLPNFFMLLGPNSGLGHNSMIYMIESQLMHIVGCLNELRNTGMGVVEVRAEVEKEFADWVQTRGSETVFQTGCRSWYLDANGRNTAIWPSFSFAFRRRVKDFNPEDFVTKAANSTIRS